MNLHTPSGRPAIGLVLALLTVWLWGTIPVVLKILLRSVDVATLTWCRFLTAGVLLLPLALRGGGLTAAARLRGLPLIVLLLSVVGLLGNHLAHQSGLRFISPGTSQVVVQLSPVFMLLGGLLVYRERFSRLQWLGVFVLGAGLLLFFSPRVDALLGDVRHQGIAVLLTATSALLWAVYLMAQKQLLLWLRPEVVLTVIYFVGAVLLTPFAEPAAIARQDGEGLLLLAAITAMTIVSYLSFARALDRVAASRIGMLIALTPLIVVANVLLLSRVAPGRLEPEPLSLVTLTGAGLVVLGSMLSALGRASGNRRGTAEA